MCTYVENNYFFHCYNLKKPTSFFVCINSKHTAAKTWKLHRTRSFSGFFLGFSLFSLEKETRINSIHFCFRDQFWPQSETFLTFWTILLFDDISWFKLMFQHETGKGHNHDYDYQWNKGQEVLALWWPAPVT